MRNRLNLLFATSAVLSLVLIFLSLALASIPSVQATMVDTSTTTHTSHLVGTGPLFETVLYMPDEKGYATVPDNDSLDLGVGDGEDFTIDAFFYVPDLDYDDTSLDLIARKKESYSFYINFNNGNSDWITFEIWTTLFNTYKLSAEISEIPVGWHHVAAVYDNEFTENEDTLAIYLDGDRVAYSPEGTIQVDMTPGLFNSTQKLEVGGVQGGVGFYGYLDEIRQSSIVRYSGPAYTVPTEPFTTDADTRALWHFDEIPGSTDFADDTSYSNDLTGGDGAQTYKQAESDLLYLPMVMKGTAPVDGPTPTTTLTPTPTTESGPTSTPTPTTTPTTSTEPLFETVLYMPDEKGYAAIPDNDSLDLGVGDGEDFTIDAFFYVPDLDYDDFKADLIAQKDESYSFYISFNNGKSDWIIFKIWTSLFYTYELAAEINEIPVGWHHVAAVYDNEFTENEDTLAIYLDGDRIAYSPDGTIQVDMTPGLLNSIQKLEVGGVQGGVGFYGYLEEIRQSSVVRYSGPAYTVPTEPFTSDADTRALWHFDETPGSTVFEDASSFSNDLTGGDGAQTYKP